MNILLRANAPDTPWKLELAQLGDTLWINREKGLSAFRTPKALTISIADPAAYEFVVVKEFRLILPVFSPDSFGLWVNARREMVCQNLDTGELSAMRKVLPIRSFSAQEEWKSTNAEIWKRVGQNHGDARRGVKSCARRAALMPASLPPMMRIDEGIRLWFTFNGHPEAPGKAHRDSCVPRLMPAA